MAEEIRVFGEFNRDQCESCAEKDDCRGFLLANIILEGAIDSVKNNAKRAKFLFGKAVDEALQSFNEAGRQTSRSHNKSAYNMLNGINQLSERVEQVTTVVITHAVKAQVETDAEQRLHNMENALESYVSRKHFKFPIGIDKELLDEAGRDVWLYATSGKCWALNVDDSRRREF
jgi:hypothetical protein